MYTFDGRIRYSETDPDGYLTMESLINYFQDCSTFQSEDLGIGIEYLQSRHYGWLVNFWQLDILRMPKQAEYVVTGTSPYQIKGFMGLRNFMMETGDGERLVNANSVWTLMDMQQMRPAHCPSEILNRYELFPKFDMEYLPRKIRIPTEGGTAQEPVHITQQHLDSNHHVNNGQYVRMALTGEPEEHSIRRLSVEYKRQAHLGDVITPVLYGDRSAEHLVALTAEDGSVYAAVKIE